MASDIKITSLMAIGGVGSVTLTAYAASPLGMTCLPYMQASKIEFWVSNNNNRANATKLTESEVGVAVHGGLAANVTRYYWARAIDPEGNEGEFYPVSPTGGLSATTLTTAPGPNSVGSTELQNNAVTNAKIANLAVTSAKIQSLEAGKIAAGTITATISINGPTITGGTVQTASSGARIFMHSNRIHVTNAGSADIAVISAGAFDEVLYINSGTRKAFAIASQSPVGTISGSGTGNALSVTSTGTGGIAFSGSNTGGGGGGGLVGTPSSFGGYAFYAVTGGYGPFTGSHDAMILKDDLAQPGDIVFDKRVLQRAGWGDVLTEVALAEDVGKRGVVGIVAARVPFEPMSDFASFRAPFDHRTDRQRERGIGQPPEPGIVRRSWVDRYDRLSINSVGEGQMNVCGRGGDLLCGDLICASDLAGKGQRQHDDIVRSWTVAKARESVTFDHPDQVKIVAVIYLCG